MSRNLTSAFKTIEKQEFLAGALDGQGFLAKFSDFTPADVRFHREGGGAVLGDKRADGRARGREGV